MTGLHGVQASIQQQKATGSVGILRVAGFETGLPDKRCLLVTQVAGNGHAAYRTASDVTIYLTTRTDARQHCPGNSKSIQNFVVPLEVPRFINCVRLALVTSVT